MTDLTFDNPAGVTFEVSPETRTIKGLAVPFGAVGRDGTTGQSWTFAKGSIALGRVKLLNAHDWSQVLGVAELSETDEGVLMTAKVANTRLGDEVLELAGMGAVDGLSVGLGADVKFTVRAGVNHVTSSTAREVSTTPIPAFSDASIRSVAASAVTPEGTPPMTDTVTEVETPEVSFSASAGATLAAKVDALATKVDGLADLKIPVGAAGAQFAVAEEPIYRFDGLGASSGHDLSADLIAGIGGDKAAYSRVLAFMSEAVINPTGLAPTFVDTGDTAAVNPAKYRPDLFKDEPPAQPAPMYDTFHAGGLSDVTPFFYSKLGAYSGLIADHVEGTPPTAGSFETETGATITPSAVSGRIFLTREVADQGGNPQVSGLIWAKFQRVFREMLELRTAKVLHDNLANFATLATPAVGATGQVIGENLKAGLVDLQFTSNGSRFSKFFSAKQLYAALAAAKDKQDRPLFPILAASNADGTTTNRLGNINVAGISLEPTWSTENDWNGATAGGLDNASFYVDPLAVKVWNSGLTRLDKVGETAAGWNIDVFAYVAAHLYDATGVRKVTYTAV